MKNLRPDYIYILFTAIFAGLLFVGCSKKERVQKALASYDFEKAYELAAGDSRRLREVAEAEIKYDIQNGNEEHAFQIAQERDLIKVYTENIQNAVTKHIHDKNFDKAIDILSSWQLEHSGELESYTVPLSDIDYQNKDYNQEVNNYNELINSLMNAAYQADDQNAIQNGLKLYKPNMVVKSKTLVCKAADSRYGQNEYDITWEAKNTAYESAVKRFTKK